MKRIIQNAKAKMGEKGFDATHFVWQFTFSNLIRAAAIMKMHNHVYDDNTIVNSNADDDLIVGPHNFPLTGNQFKDCDGVYGVEEGNRGQWCRWGKAANTVERRKKEHKRCSKKYSADSLDSRFYSMYPPKDVVDKREEGSYRNTFDQLNVHVAVGFEKGQSNTNMNKLNQLFTWPASVTHALKQAPRRGLHNIISNKPQKVSHGLLPF